MAKREHRVSLAATEVCLQLDQRISTIVGKPPHCSDKQNRDGKEGAAEKLNSGTNPDLQSVKAGQPASLVVSFQFSPGMSLTQLSSGTGPYAMSYSGSHSVTLVPEPSTLALCLLGGLGLLCFRCRK